MKNNSRFEKIIALVDDHQFLTVAELSDMCGVSEMTIRRDLEKLNSRGNLKRTHGGVVSLSAKKVNKELTSSP